ncbi:hypothetical protein [Neobacillus cucumis]
MVNLLLRLYNPPKNTIFVDHQDIKGYSLKNTSHLNCLRTARKFFIFHHD